MEAVGYAHSAKQAKRIKKFIENPDSTSGILTQPRVIEAGETVTIKSGRQAILADTVVDGDLVIEAGADVFVPAGSGFGDLESQIALKADTSYVDGKYSGFKNLIINGGFDIWQRGSGPFTNYNYGPDRWACAGGTHNSSATADNVGKRIIHITNTVAETSLLLQAIELNLTGYNAPFNVGKTFTISIRYSSSTRIKPKVQFTTGAAGNSPVDIFSTAEYKGGSGIDEVVSWTFTVPNICGSTNNCALLAIIGESVATNCYIYYVQLEEGSVATTFEQRPIGLELSLCQRYARDIGNNQLYGQIGNGFAYSNTNALIEVDVGGMRTSPVISNTLTASQFEIECAGRFTLSAISIHGSATANTNKINLDCTTTGLTAGWGVGLRNNNSTTNKIILSAEL